MIFLSQIDPKWRDLKLGRTWLSASRWGCATFALSMMSDRFGCYRSPDDIAKNPKHYNPRGLIYWENVKFDRMEFVKRIRRRNLQAIDEYLIPGKGVLAQVNWSHWVLLIEKQGNDYLAIDPWGGEEIKVFEKYGRITGSVHYRAK